MTTTIVTPDLDAIVSEIDVAAPADRVFQALTDSEQLVRWFTDASCPVKFWRMDARKGGRYSYATRKGNFEVNGVSEFECHGEILEIDPPRLLVYTWIGNWHLDKQRKTIVRWELESKGAGTHVKVTHSGLAQEQVAREDYRGGWPGVVEKLKQFVEEYGGACMATVAVPPDQDAVQLEIQIAAPPDRVFHALTDPRQLLQWWGQKGMYHGTNWTTDVRPGGRWRSEGVSDTDGSPFNVSGEYLEVDPPRTLAYTWVASWTGSLKTVVRWTLEPVAGGTRVQLRHTGFAQVPGAAKEHGLGWQRVTGWMKAFVEKGTTVGDRLAPL